MSFLGEQTVRVFCGIISRRSAQLIQLTLQYCTYVTTSDMSFCRSSRMPLMDLLVHAASTHQFNPSDYCVINPQARYPVAFTPNTPVGEMNTSLVHIVHKGDPVVNNITKPAKASTKANGQRAEPFEVCLYYYFRAGRVTKCTGKLK